MSEEARGRIPLGSVLFDSKKRKWVILSFIGIDGSAESYEAERKRKKSTDHQVFLKLKPHGDASFTSEMDFYKKHAKDAEIRKWITYRNIQYNNLGVPCYLGHGMNVKIGNTNFDFLILERYSIDLKTLLIKHNNLFPEPTSLKIAYHTLQVLEYFHAKGFVHGNVQASNLRLGKHNKNCLYLLPQVHAMDKFSSKAIMFWSEDRHNGVCTKIGDFESLLYSIIDWSGGILPWKNALPGVAKDMKIQAFVNPQKFLQDVFPSCKCKDSTRCLTARKCTISGNPIAASECLPAITKFMEHVVFLKMIDDSKPNYGIIKVDESSASQDLFATGDCPSVGLAEKSMEQVCSVSLSRCHDYHNSSSRSLSEMRQTLPNALSSPLPESNGLQTLVSPACSSGYGSRPPGQIDNHSDNSSFLSADRSLDKVHHQSSRKVIAKTKVAADRQVTGRRSVVPVEWGEWSDTCEWLTTWLDMREPNLRVLRTATPSKPELMAKQMQKVRVLLSAFNMQDSVDRMNHLLEALDKLPPDSAAAEELKQIEQRWRDGLALLEERGRRLGDTSLEQLRDVLQQVRNSLDQLLLSEEQLPHDFETLAEQLQSQQTLLVNTEIVVKLSTEVLDDFNIQSKLQALNKLYEDLQQGIQVKKAEVEKRLDDSCEKIDVWLAKKLDTLGNLVLSACRPTLQKQCEFYKSVCQRIRRGESEVTKLVEESGVLSRPPNLKISTLQQRVLDLRSRCDHLMKRSNEIDIKLQSCVDHCNKYYGARDLFLEWLGEAKHKFTLSNDVKKQLEEMSVFSNVILEKSGEFERLIELGNSFVSACNENGDVVKNELVIIKDRWDKLNEDFRNRRQSLLNFSSCSISVKESLHKIELCMDELMSHYTSEGAAKESEIMNCYKEMEKKLVSLNKSFNVVRQQAGDRNEKSSVKRKRDSNSDWTPSRDFGSVDNDSGLNLSCSTKRKR